MIHKKIKGGFILLFLLLFITGCSLSPGGEIIEQTDAEYAQNEDGDSSGNVGELSDFKENLIWVHVCGQVNNPGVYSFSENSRVFDAVEAAGGFRKEADRDSVNLAMNLTDEGKIYIPSIKEENESGGQSQSDGRINVNTATLNDLMSLPGIGEKRAESILKLRDSKGSFQTVEELLEAEGIKEGIFEQIKDFIKV